MEILPKNTFFKAPKYLNSNLKGIINIQTNLSNELHAFRLNKKLEIFHKENTHISKRKN